MLFFFFSRLGIAPLACYGARVRTPCVIVRVRCFLCGRRVCFRVAQLENWVFESDKPDAELKLIDFGLSTYFGKVRRGRFC